MLIDDLQKEIISKHIKCIYLGMDGCIAELSYKGNINVDRWYQDGVFSERRPMISIIDKIGDIMEECGCVVFILSTSPNNISSMEKEKWISKYVNFINMDSIILVGNPDDRVRTINEIQESFADNLTDIRYKKLYEVAKFDKIGFIEHRNRKLTAVDILKHYTLVIDNDISMLHEAEKEGYNAWHISRLVD